MTWQLGLLFHLFGVIFNLIRKLDDLIWSTVQLMWDDLLKVLKQRKETEAKEVSHNYTTRCLVVRCLSDLKALHSARGMSLQDVSIN